MKYTTKTVTERNIKLCIYMRNQNEDNEAEFRTIVVTDNTILTL